MMMMMIIIIIIIIIIITEFFKMNLQFETRWAIKVNTDKYI
jgi:hypothetical protein